MKPQGELSESVIAIIDSHVAWLAAWSHAILTGQELDGGPLLSAQTESEAEAMAGFAGFVSAVAARGLSGQPATLRLVDLHEALHREAQQLLQFRLASGRQPQAEAHAHVLQLFTGFMKQVRRFERAFASAATRLDALTGVRTRKGMMDELEREMARFERHGEPFCIAICDIDRFKGVNDTYGHSAGDTVLEAVAARLDKALRSFDDLYRLGGEEFLLVLKHVSAAQAGPVLERLRQDVSAAPIHLPGGETLSVTASFGYAEVGGGLALHRLIERADNALYSAKHGGRDCVRAWQPDAALEA